MDEILADASIQAVLTGTRMPRMNSIMERWVQTCRRELLDRCLLWNDGHLRHSLGEYEKLNNEHRAHQALDQAAYSAPPRPAHRTGAHPGPEYPPARPEVVTSSDTLHDRLGAILHKYPHAA
ncbi:hypothetical protein ACFYUV_49735 [Nonomuraea sp. NPDC003560]|uniref:hypothetical protein n=1 Tax=Nonomuraea sp. NPDC003560 TaxID=3364341 RepID=UPI0036AB10CF